MINYDKIQVKLRITVIFPSRSIKYQSISSKGRGQDFSPRKEIKKKKILVVHTLPLIKAPTAIGARNPGKVAAQLVIPMSVPAKFGAMSRWEFMKPQNIAPLSPTPKQRRTMARVLLQPAYPTSTMHAMGP